MNKINLWWRMCCPWAIDKIPFVLYASALPMTLWEVEDNELWPMDILPEGGGIVIDCKIIYGQGKDYIP